MAHKGKGFFFRAFIFMFFCMFSKPTLAVDFNNQTGNSFSYLINKPEGKTEIKSFMDHVLKQFDSTLFISFIDKLPPDQTNDFLYKTLQKDFNDHKPSFLFLSKYKALRHQQAVMGEQLAQLLPKKAGKPITYLEIGTPATYLESIKKCSKVERAIVMCSSNSVQDYIHAWSYNPLKLFKAYDLALSLNDYEAILESDVASNSVDIVVCMIGLHHIPLEKLQPFVDSIYRVLKKEGLFILREHDAYNDPIKAIVQGAHTIFNIISAQASVAEEMAEYRNFQPLSYWLAVTKQSGFFDMGSRIKQEGDPTLNTLMAFKK